jgi:hypothetical protein
MPEYLSGIPLPPLSIRMAWYLDLTLDVTRSRISVLETLIQFRLDVANLKLQVQINHSHSLSGPESI